MTPRLDACVKCNCTVEVTHWLGWFASVSTHGVLGIALVDADGAILIIGTCGGRINENSGDVIEKSHFRK